MSPDPRMPDDDQLEAFLRGEDAASRAYAGIKDTQPSADLDAAVLAFAHTAAVKNPLPSRLHRWQRPLALAAVLTLSMGLLLQLWKEPAVRRPVVAREQAPRATVAQASPITSVAPSPPLEAVPAPVDRLVAPKKQTPADIGTRDREPAAAIAPSSPGIAAAKAPHAKDAPAPVPAEPENFTGRERSSRAAGAPAAAAAADTMSESAASTNQDDLRRNAVEAEPVQRALAQPREAPRALAAMPSAGPKKLEPPAPDWQAPVFDTLQLGEATQAQVRARFGAPDSQDPSAPDADNARQTQGRHDFYDHLPGKTGAFEFHYERGSLRLLKVIRLLKPPVNAHSLLAELGWDEAPVIREPQSSVVEKTERSRLWLFPARGAYLVLLPDDRVDRLIVQLGDPAQ